MQRELGPLRRRAAMWDEVECRRCDGRGSCLHCLRGVAGFRCPCGETVPIAFAECVCGLTVPPGARRSEAERAAGGAPEASVPVEGYLTEWGLRIDGPDGPKILTRASKAEAEHWLANGRLNGQAYSALGAEVVSRTTSDWLSDPERGGTPWSEVLAEAGHAAHQDQWGTTLCAEDGQPWPCRTVLIVENSHLKGRLDYVTSWGDAWFRKANPCDPTQPDPQHKDRR